VAANKNDLETRNIEVWVFDSATGKARRIASDPGSKASPVWSPDGKQIAYVSSIGGQNSVYRKSSDGSGNAELLYQHPPGADLVLTDWSAGGLICFWSGKLMYALPVNGERKPVELFHETFDVRGGRFSPNGRFVAYNSNESGKFQLYVGPFDASAIKAARGPQISKDPAAGGIFWREDGTELYFLALPPQQAVMAVDVNGLEAGTPRFLFKVPSPIMAPAQLSSVASRDGQTFVFLQQVTGSGR
jgi:Tol biopolymer transport system component